MNPKERGGTIAVFLDFCSLHQKDAAGKRTEQEAALFGRALSSLSELYSHPHLFLLKLTRMPAGYPDGYTFPEGISPNKAEYRGRGWCFCESAMGNLIKDSNKALDLGALM